MVTRLEAPRGACATCSTGSSWRRSPPPPPAAAAHRRWLPSAPPASRRRCPAPPPRATDFHQSLLVATERPADVPPPLAALAVREAEADGELAAAAWLRALSFYRYPEERKFAAEVHRTMVAEEEVKALKAARLNRKLDGTNGSGERQACLVALCPAAELAAPGAPELDARLLVSSASAPLAGSDTGGGPRERAAAAAAVAAGGQLAVVGTLDVYAARALAGEVLIGSSQNAAYLANVCSAPAARRRGVGTALLAAARDLARTWGVEELYVHTMAVNEIAVQFYDREGFVVEKEESSNQAHYRGRCLDGIEGRGRTVLLRDTRLRG